MHVETGRMSGQRHPAIETRGAQFDAVRRGSGTGGRPRRRAEEGTERAPEVPSDPDPGVRIHGTSPRRSSGEHALRQPRRQLRPGQLSVGGGGEGASTARDESRGRQERAERGKGREKGEGDE
eukprot:1986844-Alexandrium_andersonii.AAC.1